MKPFANAPCLVSGLHRFGRLEHGRVAPRTGCQRGDLVEDLRATDAKHQVLQPDHLRPQVLAGERDAGGAALLHLGDRRLQVGEGRRAGVRPGLAQHRLVLPHQLVVGTGLGDAVDLVVERREPEHVLRGVLRLPLRVGVECGRQVADVTTLHPLLEQLAAVGEEHRRRLVAGHRDRDLLLVRLATDPVDGDVTAAGVLVVELLDQVLDDVLRRRRLGDRPQCQRSAAARRNCRRTRRPR